ncbi:hypothetical protein B188_29170 [Candidatus Brocadiaceae bacterium B188]|nr:hypothetical protein B188_29170 [Candidatus Brocadiaceae bacterium B188]
MERKQYNGEFKARVAIEAIKGEKTANEIAGQYGYINADSTVEEASNGRDTGDIFHEEGTRRKKGGRIACVIVTSRSGN